MTRSRKEGGVGGGLLLLLSVMVVVLLAAAVVIMLQLVLFVFVELFAHIRKDKNSSPRRFS